MHGSPTNLASRVAKLEGLLKEEKNSTHDAKLMLEASSLSVWEVDVGLKEEKYAHSRDKRIFLQECGGPTGAACS